MKQTPKLDRYLTTAQVAERLQLSLREVRRLREEDKLPFIKLGHRSVRIAESQLLRYLAGHTRVIA